MIRTSETAMSWPNRDGDAHAVLQQLALLSDESVTAGAVEPSQKLLYVLDPNRIVSVPVVFNSRICTWTCGHAVGHG